MMLQGLPVKISCLLLSAFLGGCVTEHTYSGTDIPVQTRKFDKTAAARERVQLALTYLKRGNMEQAKYNLDKAKTHNPKLEEVHVARAYYYQTVGDIERANSAYEAAMSSASPSGDVMNNFGVFLCQQQQYDKAESLFLAAIDVPNYTRMASSYENLGLCSRQANEYGKAREYFSKALQYEPRRAKSLLELVATALQEQDFQQAQLDLVRYHDVLPQSPQSLAFGVNVEQNLGNSALAEHYGMLLVAKFPTSDQAKVYRASLINE